MTAKIKTQDRLKAVKRVINGEKVTVVCRELGVSRTVFYKWFKRYKSSNNKFFSLAPKGFVPVEWKRETLSPRQRHQMIDRVKVGDTITNACKVFNVSRTTFYKWYNRYEYSEAGEKYEALEDKRPKVERYYRQAPIKYEQAVLNAVKKYPELSSHKLVWVLPQIGKKPILGNHGVQNVLRRHNLNTYEQRFAYSQSESVLSSFATGLISIFENLFGSILWQKPQFRGVLVKSSFTLLLALFTGIIFYGGISLVKFMSASGSIGFSIGVIFSLISLAFGMVFFIYSLKYYLTIAIVLSFSRYMEEEEGPSRGGSFLSKIFGNQSNNGGKRKPIYRSGGGLDPDLSDINLERNPFVSIHLATYNEKRVIDRLLTAATSMEYENYEVVIVDDSKDETVELLKKWAKHPRVRMIHRASREGYKGSALAEALKKTDPRAEFVLIFDADFIPYPDTIIQFLKYFQKTVGSLNKGRIQGSNTAAVQGYQWHVLNKSENWITRGVRSEYAGSYVIERSGTEIYSGLKQISGSVYMIRKDIVKSVGWGTSITEDFQLTLKLYEKGYKVVYTPYIQAPAEAVSTIRRLIRQRMRWAEGHSFNVRRMFLRLIKSKNLSRSEKFEFVYLSPYYLQAFFFLLGTFCWFTAEVIFKVQLPFWTQIWGWSLVFTNMFALPLMNMVGLFLEESEEKDYLGLFSFVVLSYIVAPFQGYAALKGFIEKEEGPWFRTPKTGRITDIFTPGKFYRFVSGIFGKPAKPAPVYHSINAGMSHLLSSKYLALATSNNTFSNFNSRIPRIKSRKQSRIILSVFIIIVILINHLAFFVPRTEAAAPDPTIGQQINIIDQETTAGGTDKGIVYIEPAYYTGATYYFEVVAKLTSGTGTAVLTYDAGTTSTPTGGSTVTISSISATSYTRYRSDAFTPTGGNAYVSSLTGTGTSIVAARIIIIQTASPAITNTETQVEVGDNTTTTSTSSTNIIFSPKLFIYDSTRYDGTVTASFEATLSSNTGGVAANAFLYDETAGAAVTNSTVTVTGTTWGRVRNTTAITLTSGNTYKVGLYLGAAGIARLANAKIIINQSTVDGITKLETYQQYLNTVKDTLNVGTFSTTNQTQLNTGAEDPGHSKITLAGTTYIYASGGRSGTGAYTYYSTAYKGTLSASGDVTFATTSNPLPLKLSGPTQLTYTINGTNYIYILGGASSGTVRYSTVYRATLDSNGDINTTFTTSGGQLLQKSNRHATAVATIGGTYYVYMIGGGDGGTSSLVYMATINSTSGVFSAWTKTGITQLPKKFKYNEAFTRTYGGTNYIYVLGGDDGTNFYSTVYRSTLDANGSTSTWSTTNQGQLPVAETTIGVADVDIGGTTYVYVINGYNGANVTTTYKAVIDSDGNIGTFSSVGQTSLSTVIDTFGVQSVAISGSTYIYTMGGYNASAVFKTQIDDASYASLNYNNLYDTANWAGGTFSTYHETTLKGAATTGNARIAPGSLGAVTNSSTGTYKLVRSAGISPTSGTEYYSELSTGVSTSSWLVINVTVLQTPENILYLIPLMIFMPKILNMIRKRRSQSGVKRINNYTIREINALKIKLEENKGRGPPH